MPLRQTYSGIHGFVTMDCDQGYTGQLCETDINECEGVDCSGNGECLDGVGSFSCVCSSGYTGELCEISQRVGSVVGGVFGVIIALILIIVIVVVVVLYSLYTYPIKKNHACMVSCKAETSCRR